MFIGCSGWADEFQIPAQQQSLAVSCHIMRTIITIICCFLTCTLFAQVNDADAFFNGNYDKAFIRNHSIRQVTVETYINGSRSLLSRFEFDSYGFLTNQTVFDSSGKKVNEYLFTYNKQGDQVERKNIAYDLNKTYVVSFNKIYNGSQLIQETSSELPFVTTYTYDEGGKKVQSTVFLAADTTTSAKRVSIYTYDVNGKLTIMQETYVENKGFDPVSTGKTLYLYDTAGNVIQILSEEKANYVLSYNANGLLQSKTTNMPDGFSNMKVIDKFSYSFWK